MTTTTTRPRTPAMPRHDRIRSINPATGELLESFPETTPARLERILRDAEVAFAQWRRRPLADRAAVLRRAAERLREGRTAYARRMALEMGKPLAEGEAEAEKCAFVCDYYADNAADYLAPKARLLGDASAYVRLDPLGSLLAIMPWNFPFWQVFRFAAPALVAGNTVVLKHAPNVTRCALLIETLLGEAGAPPGVFQVAVLRNESVAKVIADPRIRGVTLTGSDRAGRQVAALAGRHLKKTVLELGGSDAFIVLEDADLAAAATSAADARLVNSGQSCIAAKRFIVVDAVADRFLERFVAEMSGRILGDPLSRSTRIGPQARHDLRANLHRQVQDSLRAGARLDLGGTLPEGPGAFYPPTVLTGVRPGMPAFDEEVFGPVAAVTRVREENEAVRLANASAYGLGAAVWTGDRPRAERIAAELEVGCVFVNGLVKSDPRLPFGGVKDSGYGRELSEYGPRQFVNIKTVSVA